MRKIIGKPLLFVLCAVFIFSACSMHSGNEEAEETAPVETLLNEPVIPLSVIEHLAYLPDVTYEPVEETPPPATEEPTEEISRVSDEEIELLALITMAEAEGECEEGKRLVIDTVLNRVDSPYFPDTIYEVIYQPYHFSPVWNGRMDRCEVRDDICQLVREELESRTNYDVIFFTAGGYSQYGVPMFQVENHYFSSYD